MDKAAIVDFEIEHSNDTSGKINEARNFLVSPRDYNEFGKVSARIHKDIRLEALRDPEPINFKLPEQEWVKANLPSILLYQSGILQKKVFVSFKLRNMQLKAISIYAR